METLALCCRRIMPCKGCQNFATKYLGSPQAEGSRADEEKDPGAQPPSVAMAAMRIS